MSFNKLNYDGINRMKHMFTLWADFTRLRRRKTCKLVKLVQKSFHQHAFDGIKSVARDDKIKERKTKQLNKMVSLLMANRRQFYFE